MQNTRKFSEYDNFDPLPSQIILERVYRAVNNVCEYLSIFVPVKIDLIKQANARMKNDQFVL